MIRIEYKGKPFKQKNFEKDLLQQAKVALGEGVRKQLGSIRHPETGEFPTVVISGTTLENIEAKVEGSAELLALVQERLGMTDEAALEDTTAANAPETPIVFLCWAEEDRALAYDIATGLVASGIDTQWSEWFVTSGDDFRRKIDAGLEVCTHFIALLTPNSIVKEWVNLEIDAGIQLKTSRKAKFIPLRAKGFRTTDLPPTLSGMYAPEINDVGKDLRQLINDIHGVTRKPPLGKVPPVVEAGRTTSTGYTSAAEAIARIFVEASKTARKFDPWIRLDDLAEKTGLTKEDVRDAAFELGSFLESNRDDYYPTAALFVEFDENWQPWSPEQDALKLAVDMLNADEFPSNPSEIGERYGWPPRRLNPAITYLSDRNLANCLQGLGGGEWIALSVEKTDATRRFVKSRT